MVLTRAELDASPAGWAEELALQETGWDMAVELVQKQERRKQSRSQQPEGGRPVYGMRGVRMGQ